MQLWREIYQEHYLKDPQGFRLTDDEIAEVEKRNEAYCVFLPAELDLRELFDWESTDRKKYTCTEIKNHFKELKKYDVSQIGKALTKLKNNPDYGIITTHTGNYTRYSLPRFD